MLEINNIPMITIGETVNRTGYTKQAIHWRCKNNKIPGATKIGVHWYVPALWAIAHKKLKNHA